MGLDVDAVTLSRFYLQTVLLRLSLGVAPVGGKEYIRPQTGAGVGCGDHLTANSCRDHVGHAHNPTHVYVSQLLLLGRTKGTTERPFFCNI